MSVLPTTLVLPGRAGLLQDHLLVQASADDIDDACGWASRIGSGIVVTGVRAIDVAKRLDGSRAGLPVLADRRRYAGRSRALGTATFNARWIDDQRALGLPAVLSDSGYIGRGDVKSLEAVLGQAVTAGPGVTAVLPIHTDWLRADFPTFESRLLSFGVPVALALEHRDDPLGVRATVRGLVRLLALPLDVALLGCDVSALGALAFGASWSAVGVRTSLRHLYPIDGGGYALPGGYPSALVDPALALLKVDKIAAACAATPTDPAWICGCSVCAGRRLDWLLTATQLEANAHTFELLLDRRDNLARTPAGALRMQSWRAQCRSAEFQYQALALAGVAWEVPAFLRNWQAV